MTLSLFYQVAIGFIPLSFIVPLDRVADVLLPEGQSAHFRPVLRSLLSGKEYRYCSVRCHPITPRGCSFRFPFSRHSRKKRRKSKHSVFGLNETNATSHIERVIDAGKRRSGKENDGMKLPSTGLFKRRQEPKERCPV